jgi:hypothetical protein
MAVDVEGRRTWLGATSEFEGRCDGDRLTSLFRFRVGGRELFCEVELERALDIEEEVVEVEGVKEEEGVFDAEENDTDRRRSRSHALDVDGLDDDWSDGKARTSSMLPQLTSMEGSRIAGGRLLLGSAPGVMWLYG